MSNFIRVIDFIQDAQPGYYAVVATKEKFRIPIPRKKWLFFNEIEQIDVDYKLYPVIFWASLYVMKETEESGSRGSSVIAPMVRFGDGIEAAPVIDGYVGILTPDDDGVDENLNIRNAIDNWRTENKKVAQATKQQMN